MKIPRGVWVLGLVSLCMDLSSEMTHAVLPVFLSSTLGAGMVTIGLIEGIAEATASICKVFSGVLSDRVGRRKPLVVAGYGLAALSKPLFPLAGSAAWVLAARFVDRIGKGIRGAPRDALIADLTPREVRGAAYGLRQALDTVGALLGPLAAMALLAAFAGNVRAVFWVAVAPAFAAVALLVAYVREPEKRASPASPRGLPHWRDLAKLGGAFWLVVGVGAVYALARFSEAFLVLRAYKLGLPLAWSPLALVVMNVAYVGLAYPFGRLSDRVNRVWLLAAGLVVLIASDMVLAFGQHPAIMLGGIALWGVHLAMTQGLLTAMVADTAPEALCGSAFGVFHFVTGMAALASSGLAGLLWHEYGPIATFLGGAGIASGALVGLFLWRARFRRVPPHGLR